MRKQIKREFRVAFSTKAQPLWFRVLKWCVFLSIWYRMRGTPRLYYKIGGALLAGLLLHLLVYRRKTRGWSQPWGGWNDLEAGQG